MQNSLTREKVLRILREYRRDCPYRDRIKTIGLFGSVAGDSHRMRSDVDIFVDLDPPRMFDLIGIKQELEKVLLCKVDVVLLRKRMNPVLRDQIERHGIYVR